MDQVTQQNASSAEESASASEQLTSQAEALNGMVRELQQVIGGARAITAEAQTSVSIGSERRSKVGEIPGKVTAKMNVVHKAQMHAKLAHPAGKASTGPKVVKPEEVIPLDDESKLKQF
jgi:methyl-accepting chemotaxis protein